MGKYKRVVRSLQSIKKDYNELLLGFCVDCNSKILILKRIEEMYPNTTQIENYVHKFIMDYLNKLK